MQTFNCAKHNYTAYKKKSETYLKRIKRQDCDPNIIILIPIKSLTTWHALSGKNCIILFYFWVDKFNEKNIFYVDQGWSLFCIQFLTQCLYILLQWLYIYIQFSIASITTPPSVAWKNHEGAQTREYLTSLNTSKSLLSVR